MKKIEKLRVQAHEEERNMGYNITWMGIIILGFLCWLACSPETCIPTTELVAKTSQTVLDVTLGKTKKVTTETKVVTIEHDAKGKQTQTETITPVTTIVHEDSGLNIKYIALGFVVLAFLYYQTQQGRWRGWFHYLGGQSHGDGGNH